MTWYNIMMGSSEKRPASKAVITLDNGDLLFVAGKRGMLNLVGGGWEDEDDKDALKVLSRECQEEIGVDVAALTDLEQSICTWGETICENGTRNIAQWTVFTARLTARISELHIPEDSEVTEIVTLGREEYYNHPRMLDLAGRTTREAITYGLL